MTKGDDEREREAKETLERVSRDSEAIADSGVARVVRHMTGADAPLLPDGRRDPIEVWGRRIGRAIGVVIVIYLAVSLFTQLRG
ncbi:MAG: hypothetical protein KF735_05255 [Chelatococcus sp.]|jgi:hypothetical protein|uniref:hypothetical protein n=1 Tax=unclassified Chelatococcus TaxID=2638111 RepID=UPI001BCCF942|nr:MULTISPECIES: hypothetical protein [unclassified Chelatococcus]CAH1658078.1 conserved hypothetical protein [Hyphomicrobiales bacterium]MBS7740760.1 hypothetical protein [Chelatococcus sp. HY11]MBX3537018.1 hypothetical protein [Chelatococcus sp.]MBX3546006.1 hypothetical protein [Chelatococcus sp.]MCO5079633.1 hypothetical protein [Chelatococcus sp.]